MWSTDTKETPRPISRVEFAKTSHFSENHSSPQDFVTEVVIAKRFPNTLNTRSSKLNILCNPGAISLRRRAKQKPIRLKQKENNSPPLHSFAPNLSLAPADADRPWVSEVQTKIQFAMFYGYLLTVYCITSNNRTFTVKWYLLSFKTIFKNYNFIMHYKLVILLCN